MDIQIIPLTDEFRKEIPQKLGFGSSFSNRMFTQEYLVDKGWHNAKIDRYQPFSLDPATSVLHYAQEIFEGTKAYRRTDGNINLFRPWENCRRFNESAARMAMPLLDAEEHLEAIMSLVTLEEEWVPDQPGSALYIRPFMFGTREALGVFASDSYLHAVIVGPVGPYFEGGFNPISVYISDKYRRAVLGGVGAAKTGGNYAASLLVSTEVGITTTQKQFL